jgi:hypothetical protein
MTPSPKEKAAELYHKYYTTLLPNVRMRKEISIQHATIDVKNTIDELKEFDNEDGYANSRIEYYLEVKQELEKL